MKYIVILSDGVADQPIAKYNYKTPLMMANKPYIDELCKRSRCGLLETVPADMPPGSEIANLSVLGYDVKNIYEGRGVLEAASMGIDIKNNELALRCNLICIENDIINNHSAGHISNEAAHELIKSLKNELDSNSVKLYPGVSYRHLLVIKEGNKNINCTPPHDVPGTIYKEVLVKPNTSEAYRTAEILNNLIIKSQEILKNHKINIQRIKEGKDPANSLWPWSPGYKPNMKSFQELFGIKGAVISAVDLLYGIGKYAGFKPIYVQGSTGLHDTNYEGKAKAAVEALDEVDFVYLHIEASDEAGHEGDVELKTKTIEYLDKRVVKYIIEETAKMKEEVAIALLPDHPTPCELRTHTHDPVPFMIYHPLYKADDVSIFDEESVKNGGFGLLKGDQFIKTFLKR